MSWNDAVPVVSVLSSAVVAVVSVGATYFSGRAQRKHESRQAFEGRVWERKSEVLQDLIFAAATYDKVLGEDYQSMESTSGSLAVRLVERMGTGGSVVQAYCSDRTRRAFESVADLVNHSTLDLMAQMTIEDAQASKMDAIDVQDLGAAVESRHAESNARATLNRSQTFALSQMKSSIAEFLESAREDVRAS